MKLSELKQTLKEVVKEAIQEELKEVLYESFKSGAKPQIQHNQMVPPPVEPKQSVDPQALRENYRNILGETAANFNTSQVGKPLQMNGPVDTTSPNGRLPEGEVSMDQIMGIMNK